MEQEQTENKPIYWFEKTVEYKYVIIRHSENGRIRPLSSKLEKWFGDPITNENGKFRLLEFKRSTAEFSAENKKFRRYRVSGNYLNIKEKFLKDAGISDDLGMSTLFCAWC